MYRIRTHLVLGLAGLALMFLVPPLVGQETPPSSQPAYLRIRIPAGAELLVDGTRTKQNGSERLFQSPPIPVGKKFLYSLKATWKEGGKEVVHEEVARVEAGKETFIDLHQSFLSKNGKTAEAPSKKEDTGRGTVTEPKTDEKVPPPDVAPPKKEAGEPGKPKREPDIFFLPTPQEVVNRMLDLADIKKDDVVYDLGCGDGRIVVTAAKKFGVKATGFDIDPERVKDSRENAKKNNVEKLVTILEADIFDLDLSKASVVTLYLLPELNEKLMPQLARMKPGSRIVSHDFPMDGAKPVKKERLKVKNDRGEDSEHTVYLWIVPWEKEK